MDLHNTFISFGKYIELYTLASRRSINMAGVSVKFKFSLFTLVILFGFLAVGSSSEFDYDDEEELRGYEDDRSDESEEGLRYYGRRPVQQNWVPQNNNRPNHYRQPVKVAPPMAKCRNVPQCKSCKAPTVPNYQPKPQSARSARQRSYVEEQSQFEEDHSEEDYETRYYMPFKQYYYQTTQPPRRQCNAVCKPPVPVTTQKPYVKPAPVYQHYQQPQYQYRPYGR